ncbi:MAG: carboxypeptidase regulatory-like domain-containing protein [Thermoanaerobaculia bacterium]|nr:carboxypeptidase regulatory-like domain-containing protein [Thermoanaerobaculia bacterium]
MRRVFVLTLLLLVSGAALAHDLAVWAEVVKGRVHVEAYFSDGSPVGDSPVRVTNAEGKVLLTGRTNAKGVFDFDPPAKTALTITVSAGGGHDASARIKAKDLE